MKRWSSLIMEMQIKTAMNYHLTPIRMAIIRKTTNNKFFEDVEKRDSSVHCWWECKLVQLLCKTVWWFPPKLKIELPFDPAIPLLGAYPNKMDILIWKNIHTLVFIASLFIITMIWMQSKCPSIDEWIKKMSHTKKGNSTIKMNEILTSGMTWMNGPGGCYAKWNKSDRQRQILYDFTYMWTLKSKANEQTTRQKQSCRYREQRDCCLKGGEW